MSYVMVDIESDGPIPADYSMICFGAVIVEPGLEKTFYGRLKPISEKWIPEALAVSGFTREATLAFPDAKDVMEQFRDWLSQHVSGRQPMFVSDNNGFDWQFINWYFIISSARIRLDFPPRTSARSTKASCATRFKISNISAKPRTRTTRSMMRRAMRKRSCI
jgi:DNA polymerase III epsilon subunit-like protein